MNAPLNRQTGGEGGFSLVETVIAMGILATGLLSLAGVFSLGMVHLAGSSSNLIAREKAREAVESVHTARDTKTITWSQIKNVANGGVFLDNARPLRTAGPDGLVNTTDDGLDTSRPTCTPTCLEEQLGPGVDNILGTSDDVHTGLTGYTREVAITDIVTNGVTNPTLRQIRVIVTYPVGNTTRTYTLTTFISSIS
jgi:Tfp pilus assembly protein PilV